MSVDHKRRVGDLLRPIRVTLLDANQVAVQLRATDNTPPVVTYKIRRAGDAAWQTGTHTVTVEEIQGNASTNGKLAYYPQAGDFDVPAIYETLFRVQWQGGEPEHFPRDGYFLVEVEPS